MGKKGNAFLKRLLVDEWNSEAQAAHVLPIKYGAFNFFHLCSV